MCFDIATYHEELINHATFLKILKVIYQSLKVTISSQKYKMYNM